MKNQIFSILFILVLNIFTASVVSSYSPSAFADKTPLFKLDKSVDLDSFKGTCFDLLTVVKKDLDADELNKFTFANKAAVKAAASNDFDPTVTKKIYALFTDKEAGFDKLADALAGQSATPLTARAAIAKVLDSQNLLVKKDEVGLAAATIAPFLSIVSGSGTTIKLYDGNYAIHFGYKPGGESDKDGTDPKSGRSFAVTDDRKALDPSDRYYLDELTAYTVKTSDSSDFVRTMLQILTDTDASGYSKLTQQGRQVMSDWITVYMAEHDRHLMTGLKSHPWENDLTEATLLAVAFISKTGHLVKNGKVVAGTATDLFAIGKAGSGIGETRKDRRALQKAITESMRTLHPDAVAKIESIIGKNTGDGDLFKGLMDFLNTPDTQKDVAKNAKELSEAFTQFVILARQDSDKIIKIVPDKLP